ncbi:FAD-dependent oxidoreductase [Brucella abortus]|nr:FAD-dependent oxidoreductase [Brucella abortus]
MAAGATVFTGSPVIGAEEKERQMGGQDRQRFRVTANWVVVATNAYTNAPWAEVRAELVHLPYFNMATKPLSDNLKKSILPERQGVWDTKEVLSSFRFDQQGRLVFGSVGALRNTGAAVHKAWAKKSLKRLFPQIGAVEFEGRMVWQDRHDQ